MRNLPERSCDRSVASSRDADCTSDALDSYRVPERISPLRPSDRQAGSRTESADSRLVSLIEPQLRERLAETDGAPLTQRLLRLFDSIKPQQFGDAFHLDDRKRAEFWHAKVQHQIEHDLPANESQAWLKSLEKFDKRCKRDGVSDAERAELFINTMRLMNAGEQSGGVKPCHFRPLAKTVLEQCSRSAHVSQGEHDDCTSASIEGVLQTCSPGTYSRLVADLALNGGFGREGAVLYLPKQCLEPDREARATSRKHGERSFASQLVQQFIGNLRWKNGGELPDGTSALPGSVEYRPLHPGSNREFLFHDGKPVVTKHKDGKGHVRKSRIDYPSISDEEYLGLFETLAGSDKLVVVAHAKAVDTTKDASGRQTVHAVKSAGQLRKILERCTVHANGDENSTSHYQPIIIGVHTENKPFGDRRGKGGWHAAVLHDYNPKDGTVRMDVHWAPGDDFSGLKGQKRRLRVSEVFDAMKPPRH